MNLRRLVVGHWRSFAGLLVGVVAYLLLDGVEIRHVPRLIAAWDFGGVTFLALCAWLFASTPAQSMAGNAEAQEEGEWTIFVVTLLGVVISFAAIVTGFSGKGLSEALRARHTALVALTLLVSWLVMQTCFAMRYAHEYYESDDGRSLNKGLMFPSDEAPDYWDFVYFSVVLGMTFQVSDVQIAARTLRRLATLHGFLGFIFNTVIIAVTVNIASGFLT